MKGFYVYTSDIESNVRMLWKKEDKRGYCPTKETVALMKAEPRMIRNIDVELVKMTRGTAGCGLENLHSTHVHLGTFCLP